MFAGFGFLFISIPLNLYIFRTVVHWYKEAVGRADKRVKLVNELITGIRIVKFYAWEKPFKKMIENVRGVELKAIEKHAYWMQCGMMVVFMQMPQLMQLFVFLSYALSGGVFKASVIFTTIQLFNVLRGPVSQFPSALSQFASLIVAITYLGADTAQIFMQIPKYTGQVFQGMILFFLLASDYLLFFKIKLKGLKK